MKAERFRSTIADSLEPAADAVSEHFAGKDPRVRKIAKAYELAE